MYDAWSLFHRLQTIMFAINWNVLITFRAEGTPEENQILKIYILLLF